MPAKRSATEASTTACFASPRETRSSTSLRTSCMEQGTTTAPSFIAASITSQSGRTLESMRSMRSPRRTPFARNQFATRFDRSERSAKLAFTSMPLSSAMWSAILALPRA